MRIRAKFQKYGIVRFLGHLDIMRFFQKTLRRAGLPIAFSGGYSPHPLLSFASPLGVGLESLGEYVDMEFTQTENLTMEEILLRFNQASVEGIRLCHAIALPDAAPNAMASVAAASYALIWRGNGEKWESIKGNISNFLSLDNILFEKKSKKSHRLVDLRQGIYALEVGEGPKPVLYMQVDASSGGNIKPAHVMEALADHCHFSIHHSEYALWRLDLFHRLRSGGLAPMCVLETE